MIRDFAESPDFSRHHGMAAVFAQRCLAPAGESSYN
jgi:hypothetical protein